MQHTHTYERPLAPRNSLELLRWFIFERSRLIKFDETIDRRQRLFWIIRCYLFIIIPIALLLWQMVGIFLVCWDDPALIRGVPEAQDWINEVWHTASFLEKWWIYTGYSAPDLAFGLAVGLAFGLAVGLAEGLYRGLAVGLAVGLAFGLALGLAFGLAAFGLAAVGLAGGLAFGLGWYIGYFRLVFLPVYFWLQNTRNNFKKNVYVFDELIWYPLPALDKQLIKLVPQQPLQAQAFANFLFEHREYQRQLATKLIHALKAKSWYDQPFMQEEEFSVVFEGEDLKEMTPSASWQEKQATVRNLLVDFYKQNNAHLRARSFAAFLEALKVFQQINLTESPQWNHLYFDAFRKWIKEAEERLAELQQEAALKIYNPYRTEVLVPEKHAQIFLGRQALKDKLASLIRTSEEMPLLLIQGQRRVGKTSFLNFLADLLGVGFKVIQLDLQSSMDFSNIRNWLERLRHTFNEALQIQEATKWEASDDWLSSWTLLTEHFKAHTAGKNFKVVFAMDEYEAIHIFGFKNDIPQAEQLLGAMRSFSQHQNQVVFLFVGAALFSELENPRWSNYFVQARHFKVDYLTEADTLQLITRPYPDFTIIYREDVPQRIWEWTQGHPYLVQLIGRGLVDIADTECRLTLGLNELEAVIENDVLFLDNGATSTFWNEFCDEPLRDTVRKIIRKELPEHKAALQKLLLHEFIVKKEDGYVMRVPLFERWLKKFDVELA